MQNTIDGRKKKEIDQRAKKRKYYLESSIEKKMVSKFASK